MASKRTNHWYVLALTNAGPKFVTKLGAGHYCYWNTDEPPLEFSKEWARYMCKGLTWNGITAFPVCVDYEITSQPFLYNYGYFEWHADNDNK